MGRCCGGGGWRATEEEGQLHLQEADVTSCTPGTAAEGGGPGLWLAPAGVGASITYQFISGSDSRQR